MAGAEVALPSQKDVPVAPAKLPKSGKGAFTTGMLLSKAEAKKEHQRQLALAVAWCEVPENGGAHKAAKVFALSRSQIQTAIDTTINEINGEKLARPRDPDRPGAAKAGRLGNRLCQEHQPSKV